MDIDQKKYHKYHKHHKKKKQYYSDKPSNFYKLLEDAINDMDGKINSIKGQLNRMEKTLARRPVSTYIDELKINK